MKAAKIPLKIAQKVKRFMLDKKLFEKGYRFDRVDDFLLVPIKKGTDTRTITSKFKDVKIVSRDFGKKQMQGNLKAKASSLLTKQELQHLKTAHDTIGNIAILEIDKELTKKQKQIAQVLIDSHKNITTVLKKGGIHTGVFRTQKMVHLAGRKTKVTEHKENNVRLTLDVEQVYFSPRLSTERKRISALVKKEEDILVMFCGCAPYPCVLSKNTKAKEIYGVEINPQGHRYGLENVKKNKLKNVTLYCGDVHQVVPKITKKFDRVLMPLPKSAEDFLDVALFAAKKGATIHFYDFLHVDDFDQAREKIRKACKKAKRKCRILRTVKCGQHAPRVFRICVDFKVQ